MCWLRGRNKKMTVMENDQIIFSFCFGFVFSSSNLAFRSWHDEINVLMTLFICDCVSDFVLRWFCCDSQCYRVDCLLNGDKCWGRNLNGNRLKSRLWLKTSLCMLTAYALLHRGKVWTERPDERPVHQKSKTIDQTNNLAYHKNSYFNCISGTFFLHNLAIC